MGQGNKINIVIVDDDREIREMIINMLEDWQDIYDIDRVVTFHIRQFTNGKDMVGDMKIKKWKPQLCCVDYQMDYGNGAYVVENLKKLIPNNDYSVLVITAWPNADDITRISKECVVVDKIDPEVIETALRTELEIIKGSLERHNILISA